MLDHDAKTILEGSSGGTLESLLLIESRGHAGPAQLM
jgi:hypothetical protein